MASGGSLWCVCGYLIYADLDMCVWMPSAWSDVPQCVARGIAGDCLLVMPPHQCLNSKQKAHYHSAGSCNLMTLHVLHWFTAITACILTYFSGYAAESTPSHLMQPWLVQVFRVCVHQILSHSSYSHHNTLEHDVPILYLAQLGCRYVCYRFQLRYFGAEHVG